jgi:hypothetical protein
MLNNEQQLFFAYEKLRSSAEWIWKLRSEGNKDKDRDEQAFDNLVDCLNEINILHGIERYE